MNLTLATDVVLAAGGGLGGAGTSGIALTNGIVLLAGLRGSKRVKLNRDKAGGLGIGLGVLGATAGTALSQLSTSAAEIPKSLIAGGTFGDMSMGGTALALTAIIFLFDWKKLWIPAGLGIAAGVIYAQAGGIWGIVHNGILMTARAIGAL